MDKEYLAFVDEIGRTRNGEYLYRFDFTYEPDSVWGDYFNIVPSILVPDLQPDINSLSHSGKVISKYELLTAKRNNCFSMQDCIDGIISLCFSNIENETYLYKDTPLYFNFGETFEEVMEKLNKCDLKIVELEEVKKDGDDMIDTIIENIENNEKDDFFD